VLREIKQLMLTPELAGNVVFLEDYDLQLARWLVTGVDVWLNNPVAPLEASVPRASRRLSTARLTSAFSMAGGPRASTTTMAGISPWTAQDADGAMR